MPDLILVPMQQCEQVEELSAQVGKYTVYLLISIDPEAWQCTCPSFGYQKGLDKMGYCKHIREHIAQRCTWHELTGVHQTEEQRNNNICPECGGRTVWRNVGV